MRLLFSVCWLLILGVGFNLRAGAPIPSPIETVASPKRSVFRVYSPRESSGDHFRIDTGFNNATFKGFHYKPHDAGKNYRDAAIDTLKGENISPILQPLSWEFREQQ
jgi:hypothetical protein